MRGCLQTLCRHPRLALLLQGEQWSRPEPQLRRRACPRRIPYHLRQRRGAALRLSEQHQAPSRRGHRCLRRSRPCAPLVHTHPEGHLLLHDLVLHHGRHPRRHVGQVEAEAQGPRQVLSAVVQHGHPPRGLREPGRILQDALRRGHRLLLSHCRGGLHHSPHPRGMGVAQAADRLPQVFPSGVQQRHRPHQPDQASPGHAEVGPPAASRLHRRSHRPAAHRHSRFAFQLPAGSSCP